MALVTTVWHCYTCKRTHVRKFAEKDVRDFMVAQCPRCGRNRRRMVRVRERAFSGSVGASRKPTTAPAKGGGTPEAPEGSGAILTREEPPSAPFRTVGAPKKPTGGLRRVLQGPEAPSRIICRSAVGCEYDGQYWHRPIHWMPFPKPPAARLRTGTET